MYTWLKSIARGIYYLKHIIEFLKVSTQMNWICSGSHVSRWRRADRMELENKTAEKPTANLDKQHMWASEIHARPSMMATSMPQIVYWWGVVRRGKCIAYSPTRLRCPHTMSAMCVCVWVTVPEVNAYSSQPATRYQDWFDEIFCQRKLWCSKLVALDLLCMTAIGDHGLCYALCSGHPARLVICIGHWWCGCTQPHICHMRRQNILIQNVWTPYIVWTSSHCHNGLPTMKNGSVQFGVSGDLCIVWPE